MDAIIQDNLPQAYAFYVEHLAPLAPYVAPLQATFLHWESLFWRFAYPVIYPAYQLTSHLVHRTLHGAINTALGGGNNASSSSSSSSSSRHYSSSSSSPPLDLVVSAISSLILLYLSLQALNFVRRQVMWWIGLVTTLLTWAVLLGAGFYVFNRGIDQSVEDAAWLLGLLMGWSHEGSAKGSRLASEREWDAERFRRAGAGAAGNRMPRGRAW